jgi:selenocysteine lyase/cysteine desulfurase
MDGPAYDIARYRAQIPILAHTIPLNNCSQAPLTHITRDAAERYLESWNTRGMDWDAWMGEVEAARRAFASLINASPDEVGIVTSVSHAASAIATSLRFDGERDAVVASEAEFPTVGHVWLAQERRGARVQWVPVRAGAVALDDYEGLIDERTAIVSATHAYYQNGFVQDVQAIGRLARARGALCFVDGYQSLGAVPIDVLAMEIDILASGTLKYLMGTPGIAFLYVRRALIDRFEPLITGWFGRANPFAFEATQLDWARAASRFDCGTPPLFSAYISRAAIEWLLAAGREAIHDWTQLLSRRLIDGAHARGLTIHGPGLTAPKAPTTAIMCRDAHAVETALRSRGIIASARGPAIRLAPHFYNTTEEVDRALDALTDVLRP